MAETDFVPLYANNDPTLRPSLIPRQSGAGYRTPGFVGRALAGAQPQVAPQTGATSSGDGTAALRGLYAARSNEDYGVGNAEGGIVGGQQDTREAKSFNDLMASAAMGLTAMSGPLGFGAVMNTMDRMGYDKNVNGPVGWSDVKNANNPFANNSTIGRALGAAYNSVTEGGAGTGAPGPGPSDMGGVGVSAAQGNNVGAMMDAVSATPGIGGVEGAAGAGSNSGGGAVGGGSGVDAPGQDGNENGIYRNGGLIGAPGAPPRPVNIQAHTGEAVMRPEAVNKYGPSAMQAINQMRAPAPAIRAATGTGGPPKKGPPAPAKKAGPPPAKGKAPPKKGGAMDALARMKASR